jgi:prepilin-type N-terminal cleavage/methylation domain-containing protein
MKIIRYRGPFGKTGGSERGFTLPEMLVSLTLCTFVVIGGGEMLRQIILASSKGTDGTVAVIQVQNSAFWLTQDAMQAQGVQLGDPVTGWPLTLTWTDWDNVDHTVTYSMGNMTDDEGRTLWEMIRLDSVSAQSVTVAQYLDRNNTVVDWHATRENILVLDVMAKVGEEWETRTYEIQPRPLQ